MAISLVGLFARIGAMIGSNFVGPILIDHCISALYIFACVIICCTVAAKVALSRLELFYKNNKNLE